MLSRIIKQSWSLTSTSMRYYSTGTKKPDTKLTAKEENELLNIDISTPQFKQLIRESKQTYRNVLINLAESNQGNTAPTNVSVKPKIFISSPSGKFAHSLFEIASSMRSIGIVQKDVKVLLKTINSIPDFQTVIEGEVEPDEKIYALNLLAKNVPLTPITKFFLYYLTYEQKFKQLIQCFKDFQRLADSLSEEVNVKLTVAKKYTAQESKELEDQIKSYFPPETVFSFKYTVDPAIKGGYIIESPLLNHNASLVDAERIVEEEQKTIFAELYSEIKGSIKQGKEFWNSQEFKDRYLKFDLKDYEAKINKENN